MDRPDGLLPIVHRRTDGSRPLADRFWRKVRKTDGCWLWIGAQDHAGYGILSAPPRTLRAHRYSYILHFGVFDPALMVCHRCDTPACVRPDHLFLGTALENTRDCIAKGRRRTDPLARRTA